MQASRQEDEPASSLRVIANGEEEEVSGGEEEEEDVSTPQRLGRIREIALGILVGQGGREEDAWGGEGVGRGRGGGVWV